MKQEAPQVLEQVEFSDETYKILMEGMAQVVSGTTALENSFSSLPVKVGGKTGTAEVEGKRDYAIFSGFAPLEDPEIVVSCIIEEGEHGYSAAHTVAKIMAEYFADRSPQEE